MNKKTLPLVLVASAIVLGITLIVVSLYADRLRWDRETDLAAARHDGGALLQRLADPPAEALGMPTTEHGPLTSDLKSAREAWASWGQDFTTEHPFSRLVAWHGERLEPLSWERTDSSADKTTFTKGEWSLSLTTEPGSSPPRFRRKLLWRREIP